MDKYDAVKNIAMFYAMLLKYSRETPYQVQVQIHDYINSESNEIPVGLQPFKKNIIQFKKCIEANIRYVNEIPDEIKKPIEDKFDEIGEDKFVEWFRKQGYKEFTPIDKSLEQEEMFSKEENVDVT